MTFGLYFQLDESHSCWVQLSRTYIGSHKSAEPVGLAVQETVEFKLVIILKTGKTLRLKR
jgi:hypothetical protein